MMTFKRTGHFFETMPVGSVHGTDHSFDLRLFINIHFGSKNELYSCARVTNFYSRQYADARRAIELMALC